jgi:hypothetical protein
MSAAAVDIRNILFRVERLKVANAAKKMPRRCLHSDLPLFLHNYFEICLTNKHDRTYLYEKLIVLKTQSFLFTMAGKINMRI